MSDNLTPENPFGEIIDTYTRSQAIKDGFLVDASSGDLAEVSRQHYKYPIAMTAAVFQLIETAVNNEQYCNDWKGVWHDILWMSRMSVHRYTDTAVCFWVTIAGTGPKNTHELQLAISPGDNLEPVVTVMLANED